MLRVRPRFHYLVHGFFMSHCKDMRMKYSSVLGLSMIALLTACGGGGGGYGTTAPVNNTPAAAFAPVPLSSSNGLIDTASVSSSSGTLTGVFVSTAAQNRTVYIYDADTGMTTPQCTTGNGCLPVWPAVTVAAGTTTTAPFGTVANGSVTQLTYEGHPLYTYTGDTAAGVANGQGVSNAFFAATATITTSTQVPTY
jgi:predicted lipoprotein with Yx(FWY)xxD motif